jgi:hypothetical protein
MAAAAITLADTLSAQQQHAPDSAQPSSSSSRVQQAFDSTAYVSRSVLDIYNMSVSIAGSIPAATAAAHANAPYDETIMLKDASMAAAAAPMAQLALALLRTPLSSSSSGSSRVSSSSIDIELGVLERTVSHRRLEIRTVIIAAAQLASAVALVDPALNTQQPAAISQLLMVNLAYTALYECNCKPRRRRQQQGSGFARQLLAALGVPQEDLAEQIGTDELLPSREEMRTLGYQVENALLALFFGFTDHAHGYSENGATAGLGNTTNGSGASSSSCSRVAAGGSECSQQQPDNRQQQQQQRQPQRHVDAAGRHIVPAGVHEPLLMTVIDAALSLNKFPMLIISTCVAGFAATLLPVSEPTAEATAAAAASADASAAADAAASAAAAAEAAAEAAAATHLRVLQALLLRLTPALLAAAEDICGAEGRKPVDVTHSDSIEGSALSMLCRAVGGVAFDKGRRETQLPAAGQHSVFVF